MQAPRLERVRNRRNQEDPARNSARAGSLVKGMAHSSSNAAAARPTRGSPTALAAEVRSLGRDERVARPAIAAAGKAVVAQADFV